MEKAYSYMTKIQWRNDSLLQDFGNRKIYPPSFNEAIKRAESYKFEPTRIVASEELIDIKDIDICQHMFVLREIGKTVGFDRPILEFLGSVKLNKQKVAQIRKISPNWNWLTSVFYQPNAFTNVFALYYRMGTLLGKQNYYAKYGSQLLYDAYGLGSKTLDVQYRTGDVMAFLKSIRQTMDVSLMPIFADALQDAGFGNTAEENKVLEHYRDPKACFSLGSWVFRAAGVL